MEKKPEKKNSKKSVTSPQVQASIQAPKQTKQAKNYISLQWIVNLLSALIFIVSAYYYLLVVNSNLLYKVQELSLFLPTKLYFSLHMSIPGGLLSWLGNFFTQFFYYPWLGSLIFVSFIAFTQFLVVKVFRIKAKHFPITFVVSFALLLTISQLGYLIQNITAQGFIYSNLIGFDAVLLVLWLYRTIESVPIRAAFNVFFVAFCYPLLGFYTLLAASLFLITDVKAWLVSKTKHGWLPIVTVLLAAVLLPYIYYYLYYTQTDFASIYIEGLPDIPLLKQAIYAFWMPYFVLITSFIIFSIIPFYKSKKEVGIFSVLATSLGFLFCFMWLINGSYIDANFQTETAMDIAIFENRWEDVIELANENKNEPTRIIVMDTRLALQKLNQAGDKMFTFPDGSARVKSPAPKMLRSLIGKQMYYQYGNTSFCYHWCIEDMVEKGMKVDYLRFMVKCALIKGELKLAQKYNDVLKLTLFHEAWADKYQKFIDQPMTMMSDGEFKAIRPLTAFKDKLEDNYGPLETSLLTSFATSDCATIELLEYSLQSAMLVKSSEFFWPRYFSYVRMNKRIPRYYQEAALFFSYFERKVNIDMKTIDPQILEHFKQLLKTCDLNVGKSKVENKQTFALLFADTYWYYYFFITPNFEM